MAVFKEKASGGGAAPLGNPRTEVELPVQATPAVKQYVDSGFLKREGHKWFGVTGPGTGYQLAEIVMEGDDFVQYGAQVRPGQDPDWSPYWAQIRPRPAPIRPKKQLFSDSDPTITNRGARRSGNLLIDTILAANDFQSAAMNFAANTMSAASDLLSASVRDFLLGSPFPGAEVPDPGSPGGWVICLQWETLIDYNPDPTPDYNSGDTAGNKNDENDVKTLIIFRDKLISNKETTEITQGNLDFLDLLLKGADFIDRFRGTVSDTVGSVKDAMQSIIDGISNASDYNSFLDKFQPYLDQKIDELESEINERLLALENKEPESTGITVSDLTFFGDSYFRQSGFTDNLSNSVENSIYLSAPVYTEDI